MRSVSELILNARGFITGMTQAAASTRGMEKSVSSLGKKVDELSRRVSSSTTKQVADWRKVSAAAAAEANRQAKYNKTFIGYLALKQREESKTAQASIKLMTQESRERQANARLAMQQVKADLLLKMSKQGVILTTENLVRVLRELNGVSRGAAGGGVVGGGGGGGGGAGAGGGLMGFFAGASKLGTVFIGVLGGVGRAVNALATPLKHILGQFSLKRVFDVAAGVLIRDMIFGIARATKEAASDILNFAASLQTLDVRFQTLISRELRAADATLSVSDSMAKAEPQAQALLEWIKELSLQVPIDVSDIANTNAYAQAMGFSTSRAKELTTTILTFTSAMGLGSDVAERIVFNFGQMIAAGKLTQTELRDLARGALFPLQDVLDELASQMGVTGKGLIQLRKDAAEGKFDIQSFFKAFETVVARDFPGALERMGQTFTGAITRMKNAIKVFGGDIFGPVVAQIGRGISSIVDSLQAPEIRNNMRIIGETLLRGFTQIWEVVKGSLIPALGNLARAFGIVDPSARGFSKSLASAASNIAVFVQIASDVINWFATTFIPAFSKFAKQMFQWGAGLVIAFARGMAAGITAIVKVITLIGKIIASAFSTHSPPNIAPLIGKWGAEAMTEYIKGWLKADFTLFNQIADKIESYLRSIPGGIGMDNVGLIPRILGTREAIVKALNAIRSGSISVDQAIKRIMKSAKGITSEFRDYIQALFMVADAERRVADASRSVEQAQRAQEAASKGVAEAEAIVSAISDRYSKILDDLNRQLEEVTEEYDDQVRLEKITAALASGLLTDEEKRRLEMEKRAIEIRAQIRATEDQRDAELEGAEAVVSARRAEEQAAQRALDLAEEQMQIAEDQLELAEEQLATAEAVIDFQIKQNELLSEQLSLVEALAKAASDLAGAMGDAGAGGVGIPEFEMPEFEPIDFSAVTAAVDEFFGDIEYKAWLWYANMKYIFDTLFKPLEDAISGMKAQWSETWTNLSNDPTLRLFYAVLLTAWEVLKTAWTIFMDTVKTKWDEIIGPLKLDTIVATLLQKALYVAAALALAGIIAFISLLSIVMATYVGVLEALSTAVDGVKTIIDELTTSWSNLKDEFTVSNFVEFLWDLWGALNTFMNPGGLLLTVVEAFRDGFYGFFDDLYNSLIGNSIVPDMMDDILNEISEKLGTILEDTTTWVINMLVKMLELGAGILQTITLYLTLTNIVWMLGWKAMVDLIISVVIPALLSNLIRALSDVHRFISGTLIPTVNNLRTTALAPLATFISGTLTNTITSFRQGPLVRLTNDLEDKLIPALKDAEDAADAMKSGFNRAASAAQALIGKINQLVSALKRLQNVDTSTYVEESPVPFAEGLKKINKEAAKLAAGGLSALTSALTLLPGNLAASLANSNMVLSSPTVMAPLSGGGNVDRSIHIEINPTYKNVQSEASIFYDVTAALAAARA